MKQADEFIVKLGKVLREARLELKLSQEELAEKADLHRTYIGAIERGKRNITLKNFFIVTKALQMKASNVVALAEDFKPQLKPKKKSQ